MLGLSQPRLGSVCWAPPLAPGLGRWIPGRDCACLCFPGQQNLLLQDPQLHKPLISLWAVFPPRGGGRGPFRGGALSVFPIRERPVVQRQTIIMQALQSPCWKCLPGQQLQAQAHGSNSGVHSPWPSCASFAVLFASSWWFAVVGICMDRAGSLCSDRCKFCFPT